MNTMLSVKGVRKTFVLHNQDGIRLPVLENVSLSVQQGECLVLHGRSGSGKSTLLRALYGNYLVDEGVIEVNHRGCMQDITRAEPRDIINIRRETLGWVSQFLRAIPRITALQLVMQPLLELGTPADEAEIRAVGLLRQLNIPERLWSLAPATFSGGEQQRVNIARGFIVDYPVLLLDEPTASLDRSNSDVVVELIVSAKQRGAAIVGIFHDDHVRERVADQLLSMKPVIQTEAA